MSKSLRENKAVIVGVILIAGVLLGSFTSVIAVPSNNVSIINKWVAVQDCAYQVFTDGINYYAKNCETGAIDYSGTTAHSVFNSAITTASTGGKVYTILVKQGNYTLTAPILITNFGRLVGQDLRTESQSNILKGGSFSGTALITMSNLGSAALQYPIISGLGINCIDQSVDGIALSSYYGTVERTEVANCDEGIKFQSGGASNDNNRAYQNHVHHNVWGIVFSSAPAGQISQNDLGFNEKDAINTNGFSQRIFENKLWSSGTDTAFAAIQVTNGDYSIISNNMIEPDNVDSNGIVLTSTDYASVSDNRMKGGSGRNCIVLSSSPSNVITNNICSYTGVRAVYESTVSSDFNLISGNDFRGGTWSTATIVVNTNSNSTVIDNLGFTIPIHADCNYHTFIDGSNYRTQNCLTGAVAYSGTDAAAAIQTGLTKIASTGGIVKLRQGSYPIDSPLLVGNSTILEGSGWTTIVTLTGGGTVDLIRNANFGVSINEGVVIRDLKLDGAKALHSSSTIDAISFDKCLRCTVERNFITNAERNGIRVTGNGVTWILDNKISGNNSTGILMSAGSDDSFIVSNDIGSNAGNGITLSGVAFTYVAGNNVFLNSLAGIDISTAPRNQIDANNVHDNTQSGIRITASSSNNSADLNVISSNSLRNNNLSCGASCAEILITASGGIKVNGTSVVGNTIHIVSVGSDTCVKEATGAINYSVIVGNACRNQAGTAYTTIGGNTVQTNNVAFT